MEARFARRLKAADRRLSFVRRAPAKMVRSAKWLRERYPGAKVVCDDYMLTICNLSEKMDMAAQELTWAIKRCQGRMKPEKPLAVREMLAKKAKEAHRRR